MENAQEAVVETSGEDGGEFNADEASNRLADDLFPKTTDGGDGASEVPDGVDAAGDGAKDATADGAAVDAAAVDDSPVPKTWPAEMHPHWLKTPKEVRDYWNLREQQMITGLDQYKGDASFGKAIRSVVTPYEDMLKAQGVDAPKAVEYLLGAHHRLTYSSPQQKQQYFAELAKQYGVTLPAAAQGETGAAQPDPAVSQLQEKLNNLEQTITIQSQAVMKQEHEKIAKEVNLFAQDKAHPYFDEVADDIIVFLKAGIPLQDAYDKAIWANPVTRAKESGRLQQEQQADAKRKAQEAADAARKASAVNIRGRDTKRSPTETGRATMRNLDSVMREVQKELKEKTH